MDFRCLHFSLPNRVANYGLMDQMAALHWIQQNIEKFGGNPTMITLVGHGTGAACIDFLMSSPTMGKLSSSFSQHKHSRLPSPQFPACSIEPF